MSALELALEHAGGQTALARAIGVKQQQIWNWLHRGKGRVPAEHCPKIERITSGAVRCEDLRPDIDWGVLRIAMAAPELIATEGAPAVPTPEPATQEVSHAA